MKIITKEEQARHYSATVRGGTIGGLLGLSAGAAGVYLASARYPAFRSLSIPFRAFLATSTGTFTAIIAADRASRRFEAEQHPNLQYTDSARIQAESFEAAKPFAQRTKDWARENRYGIVGVSWVASLVIALGLVGRNPYLTGAQKLVQARVYAQGLTVAVLLASFGLEANDAGQGKGRWETVKVLDPKDPTHRHMIEKRVHHERYVGEDQWMDMVEAAERKMKEEALAKKQHQASAASTKA